MAFKATMSNPFFFIFDFYLMTGSKDDNDVVPDAILYFYPKDDQVKQQKLLDCSEIVGIVQYIQMDLFQSIPKTLHFQKSFVVHEYHGRHSAFLSLPHDQYTLEEGRIHLKHILNLFNMLYGTWNHVQSVYEKDNTLKEFLNQALTPILNHVCNQNRSILDLFSTIEYSPLKHGNQRVLLESKHFLEYLKSNYGLQNGLLGYDNKILYSTWGSDTTFNMQLLFQLKKELPKRYIQIPWESEFKLKNGVSLLRVYMRQLSSLTSVRKRIPDTTVTTTTTDPVSPTTTTSKMVTTPPIDIFDGLSSTSDESSSVQSRFSSILSPMSHGKRRRGISEFIDQSGSSEETGFETDTMDELSPASTTDTKSVSSDSINEGMDEVILEDLIIHSNTALSHASLEESLTDEQKLENLRSRSSSSVKDEREATIKNDCTNSSTEVIDRIRMTRVDFSEDEEEENLIDDKKDEEYPVTRRKLSDSSRDRGRTVTSTSDLNDQGFLRSDRHEVRISWTNIPDRNTEQELDEFVLYVQKNSRMMFAGIINQSLLNDEYLKKLWNLMLSQMANMETDIQIISSSHEIIRPSTDVKFQFNENTRLVEFERIQDGTRLYRKIPSEDSSYMALFARSELNRNPERKVVGLSRGTHLITADRRFPDRITYSCRRFQETL